MSWREQAAPIIKHVIAVVGREDTQKLKTRLREAYPLSWPGYWPRKIWNDEIRRQLGKKPPLQKGGRKPLRTPEGQGRLFT